MHQRGKPEARAALNVRQKCVVIMMDFLLLAELTYSMYRGSRDPEDMVVIFLSTFIPLVIGTLVLARIFLRRFSATG